MITLNNLQYSYTSRSPLFQDLSLQLTGGTIVGLLGKNGSGKTTLMKLICGLLFPKSANVEVLGHSPRTRNPKLLQSIFFIPEEFHLPSLNINKYVLANSGFYPNFDHQLMSNLLSECDLSENTPINQLSFGQKKKFLITFGLATKCQLLLLDEPTNGLDIPSKSVFRRIVAGSLDKHQLVMISTHQVKDIENLIDTILIIDGGNIILNKPLHHITSQIQCSKMSSVKDVEVLYSEAIPGGYHVISPQTNGTSMIELELLFNAVVSGKQILS